METNDILVFFVNGKKVTVSDPDPSMTLLHYLRTQLRLTGTKSGCGEGGCGACTVLLSSIDGDHTKHRAVTSCLTPLCHVHGQAITTVEGIGSVRSRLHPVQRALAENHGTQCGFCTPGIVMSVYALMRSNPNPTKQQLHDALDGNLCRCTGYRPILQGLYPLTKQELKGCGMGENCCQVNKTTRCSNGDDEAEKEMDAEVGERRSPFDPTQVIIFPPELKILSSKLHSQRLCFRSDRVTWYRPTSLLELSALKQEFPGSKIVAGNTGLGVSTSVKHKVFPILVSTQSVKGLHEITLTESGLEVGGSVPLTDVDNKLKDLIQELPAWKTRVFTALVAMFKCLAGTQIRNVASIGGNIITASPISDLNPILLACRAVLCVHGTGGQRRFPLEKSFFVARKKNSIKENEVLVSVFLPFTSEDEYFYAFKQATRRNGDKAIVNAGMYVCLEREDHKGPKRHKGLNEYEVQRVKEIRLAFGGMSATTMIASNTMDALVGRVWNPSLLELACSDSMLPTDLQLKAGSLGGMVAYRRTLCLSFFFRFYNSVSRELSQKDFSEEDPSLSLTIGESQGSQFYSLDKSTGQWDTIGQPVEHVAARMQCTGEAMYMDDIPVTQGELFLGLVTSTKSHARIVSVNPTTALTLDGVVTFMDHRDVPGDNQWDCMEQVFAVDEVVHEGQVIGAVVATSLQTARRAARAVKVTYEDRTPVLTIQDAIKAGTTHPVEYTLKRGHPETAFTSCPSVIEGEMHVNAQEHFYLEPHGCVVYPKDGSGELEVITTTQSPTQMQRNLSRVLGLSANKINVHVKRIGGGFGGKETRNASVLLPTAIAATKTGRPVRCVLDRGEDMCLTGTRHPAYIKYKIGFRPDGKITALDADLYLNMGCTLDVSPAVLEMALLTSDNAYNIDTFCMRGHLCQTNLTSCTAFRGFGGPQSIVMAETWISHVADFLDISYEQVRETNFYHAGDTIPCGQVINTCNIQRCWDECLKQSGFVSREKEVEEFNRNHSWTKKGIAVTPLKYGLAFLLKSLNQGAAHVSVYTDGTVLVFHGGVEMGQGLHTKMIQVVSRELDIPMSSVHIMETSTTVAPNTSATAASMSTDLNGAALIDACKTISSRLAPYKQAMPHASMKEWAQAAHNDCISLSACGFFAIRDVSMDWSRHVNNPFTYFSFGAACTEVEIDCLTGDHMVLRTDIVMDVGHSLNPAIDVGQIEGAFMQGYGMYLLEDYKVSPQGVHVSKGPSTYKIPACGNIPEVFNVSLLKDSDNPRAIYSSKGIGEPPLCLATSSFMAVKKAIKSARVQNGLKGHFRLDSPATPDKIRMACGDQFAQRYSDVLKEEDAMPWNVKL